MKYIVNINDKSYEIEVTNGEASVLKETVTKTAAPITAPVTAPIASTQPAAQSSNSVNSPMPGTIMSILVKAGDSVKKGQNLLVLEAMKMENEIKAPNDGVINQILTSTGAIVSTGDALLTLR